MSFTASHGSGPISQAKKKLAKPSSKHPKELDVELRTQIEQK